MTLQPAVLGSVPSGTQARSERRTRVLIVDDNEDSAIMLGEFLRDQGYDVDVAHDGASALDLAHLRAPELAILDIGLPDMDGHQLAVKLRQQPGLAEVRLVALTGYAGAETRAQAVAAGFHHQFIKPVELNTLQLTLGELTATL
jgi:CheY-like chemotaxis protein